MRHRMKGRKLGRNSSHRKAMFKNMATSLILSIRPDEDEPNAPKVPGRIVTTVPKAKELRPRIEKLITLARKGRQHELAAAEFATQETRGSEGWRQWREGEGWQKWVRAKAPAVAARRRAFAVLRSKEAVDILFSDLAEMFEDRPGGYTRIVRLPTRRLGDGGQQALIEFTGENDRPRLKKSAAPVVRKDESPAEEKSAPTASASSESETSDSPAEPDSESAESSESAADESSSESGEKQ